MIYLRFSIIRQPTTRSEEDMVEPSGHGVAEFMFAAEDAAESARRGAEWLRCHGWHPLAINDAREGFARADFNGIDSMECLFDVARQTGAAHLLTIAGQVEAMPLPLRASA